MLRNDELLAICACAIYPGQKSDDAAKYTALSIAEDIIEEARRRAPVTVPGTTNNSFVRELSNNEETLLENLNSLAIAMGIDKDKKMTWDGQNAPAS